MTAWLLLIVSLRPHPSSVRVRTWRKLRALGAVPLKNSVYLLPFSPEAYERFQWLTQEIQKDGGEATLLKVDRIENMKPAEVIQLFQTARNREYTALAERYRRLLRGLERKPASRRSRPRSETLERLSKEFDRLRELDFFDAPGAREVRRLKETIEMHLRSREERLPSSRPGDASLPELKEKRWVTRPRPHVDRLASAWLIKRFIDPEADFLFVPAEEFPPDAIPFDALGAELGHQGEDCTFETLLRRSGLRDRRLTQLAEIVHEVDLRDQKFPREEARGIDLAIRGLLAALKDDHELLAHALTLFDGLYATVGDRR
jgi:hypothetical protein